MGDGIQMAFLVLAEVFGCRILLGLFDSPSNRGPLSSSTQSCGWDMARGTKNVDRNRHRRRIFVIII